MPSLSTDDQQIDHCTQQWIPINRQQQHSRHIQQGSHQWYPTNLDKPTIRIYATCTSYFHEVCLLELCFNSSLHYVGLYSDCQIMPIIHTYMLHTNNGEYTSDYMSAHYCSLQRCQATCRSYFSPAIVQVNVHWASKWPPPYCVLARLLIQDVQRPAKPCNLNHHRKSCVHKLDSWTHSCLTLCLNLGMLEYYH